MSELVEINKSTALAAYSSENGLSAEVDQVRAVVDGFKHDLTNATNRAKTASLAAKVAKVKVKYDDLGKDLVSEWKAKSKLVDASRKSMRDELDAIKIEARRPLTEWEAEQSRLEEVKRAEEAAKQLQIEKESDHEMAVLMDDAFDREKAEAAAKVEADRIAHEESIKQAAIAESERKAEEERRAAIAREENLKLEAQQAEASRVVMAEQAEKNAKLAEEARVKAEKLAKINADAAADAARQAELDRQNAVKAAEEAEKAKREANKKHIGAIRKAAKESLMTLVDEDTAKKIVLAIHSGDIANITINY